MQNYTYQMIEQFTLPECKKAKIELQIAIPEIKLAMEDCRNGLNEDLDLDRLTRKYFHLRWLMSKVEIRMIDLKQEMGIPPKMKADEHERNRQINLRLVEEIKPDPYDFAFRAIASQELDGETYQKISQLARQQIR